MQRDLFLKLVHLTRGTRDPCRQVVLSALIDRIPGCLLNLLLKFSLRGNSLETTAKGLEDTGFSDAGYSLNSLAITGDYSKDTGNNSCYQQASCTSGKLGLCCF